MVAQLVFVYAAVNASEHAASAKDEINVPEGTSGSSPGPPAARRSVRRREDARQARVSTDRCHRSGDLPLAPQ
eukprot:6413812-Alexandrium_andersonii.AAC.1